MLDFLNDPQRRRAVEEEAARFRSVGDLLSEAQGSFTAPFAGTHGWYWRNKGETPVTVTVKTTGFYKDLFRPEAE